MRGGSARAPLCLPCACISLVLAAWCMLPLYATRACPPAPLLPRSASVTSVDCCMRKPLAVTASTDRSVRVWNYVERTCELSKVRPARAFPRPPPSSP